jgi:hypothetical protein
MLTGLADSSQGGLLLEDRRLRRCPWDAPTRGPKTALKLGRARLSSGLSCLSVLDLAGYDLVTVYCPQAVNWMLTVAVRAPRTTTVTIVPESNRGAVVQLALWCNGGFVVTVNE